LTSSPDQGFKTGQFIILERAVMLEIKIKPPYAQAMGQQNFSGQPGTVNGVVIEIGICPGKNLEYGPDLGMVFGRLMCQKFMSKSWFARNLAARDLFFRNSVDGDLLSGNFL
jgi:hypothetical protein